MTSVQPATASDDLFVLPDLRDGLAIAHDVCDAPAVDFPEDECKHCGGLIVWGLSHKRQRVPLERFEVGEFTLLPPVKGSGYPEPRIYRVYENDRIAVIGPRFRRHSETCTGKGRR